jgi:hypothetical protein
MSGFDFLCYVLGAFLIIEFITDKFHDFRRRK